MHSAWQIELACSEPFAFQTFLTFQLLSTYFSGHISNGGVINQTMHDLHG
jgi:hypothetical protein